MPQIGPNRPSLRFGDERRIDAVLVGDQVDTEFANGRRLASIQQHRENPTLPPVAEYRRAYEIVPSPRTTSRLDVHTTYARRETHSLATQNL